MLKVEGMNVAYKDMQVLWDINFYADKGEIISIVGGNGAGKTTIVRAISGMLKLKSGSIKYNGEEVGNLECHQVMEKGIIHVPEGRQLFDDMTVYENLELGAFNRQAKERMGEMLENIYLWFPIIKERKSQLAGTMSGGERQMVAFARGLMGRPELIMLDEPSLGLAPNIVDQILHVAKDVSGQGITVILVEQDVRKALKVSDRGYVLENGMIRLEGTSKELMNNQAVKEAYLGF